MIMCMLRNNYSVTKKKKKPVTDCGSRGPCGCVSAVCVVSA